MPSPTLYNKSLFELLFNDIPDVHHLRIFGCSVFPLLKPYNSTKLQPKTIKCIFLGYASSYKGFICYDIVHTRFYISRHVMFDESEFPYLTLSATCSVSNHSISTSVPSSPSPFILVTGTNHIVSLPHSRTPSMPEPMSHPCSDQHSGTSTPLQSITASTGHQSSSSFHVAPTIPNVSCSEIFHESPTLPSSAPGVAIQHEFQPDRLQVLLPIPHMNTHSMQT
ncbi:hypothetical protein ACFX2B_023356 [Malus domestica]